MLRIVITSVGSILMGEDVTEDGNSIVLDTPRELQVIQQGDQTKFAVLPLIGNPTTITLYQDRVSFSYIATDKSIENIYLQSTSKIATPRPSEIIELNKRRN